MASSLSSYNGLLVLMMATFFMAMGLTTSHSPLSSPSPSPLKSSASISPLFVHPPISAPVYSPLSASISQSPSSNVAPEPATNAAVTLNFSTYLVVGSVAALISAFAFLV